MTGSGVAVTGGTIVFSGEGEVTEGAGEIVPGGMYGGIEDLQHATNRAINQIIYIMK